tara:strand:- start:27162 stop:27311 length:150 start_codon:yes stop_codon:yes gene_type:complete
MSKTVFTNYDKWRAAEIDAAFARGENPISPFNAQKDEESRIRNGFPKHR